jgi:hypothetical protein
MSYDGQIDFGLVGDLDAMADLDSLALDLEGAVQEIVSTAPPRGRDQRTTRARTRNGTVSVK